MRDTKATRPVIFACKPRSPIVIPEPSGPPMPPVRIAESDIEGKGVFAAEPVEPGDVVLVVDTSRLVTEEDPLRPEAGESEDHLAYLSGGRVVLLPEPERRELDRDGEGRFT